MNLKSRKLADIDHDIRVLKRAAIAGEIFPSTARHEIQVLEDVREYLWRTHV